MPSEKEDAVREVELAVWAELGKRRWFGKHVETEEMEELEGDLHEAIANALR